MNAQTGFKMRQSDKKLVPFAGGFDTESSPWEAKPGRVRYAQNFEVSVNGGYADIRGYERFDGRTAPSAGTYSIIEVTITGEFSVGDTITQLVSGATAYVLAVVSTESPQYLVVTQVTGTFDGTNALQVSAVTEGTPATATVSSGAQTARLHAVYTNLAADRYRSSIAAVPGEGSILGVWMLNDVKYAFRNAVGSATAAMYKSTASGWSLVALGREIAFTSGGTYEIAEGDTITGATSAATAVITRVVLSSGSWASGDAAGYLVFATDTGTFQAENLNVGGNLNVATIAGDASAITLQPGGRYEFENSNFGGEANAKRMYGVDGVNFGFEFDGTVFVRIRTGMASDTPTHLCIHKLHLFFSFGSSVQHSAITAPYIWEVILGAGEIAAGDTVTGLKGEPGETTNATLGIYCANRIHMLYGTSVADWELVRYREEIGARFGTIQAAGSTMFVDQGGIKTIRVTQAYGNFAHDSLTQHIQTWVNEKRTLTACSCLCREKNQYRVFFSDDSALYVTLVKNKVIGVMPQVLGHTVTAMFSLEANDGTEVIMFGSDNGMIYQMEKGTSFDGDPYDGLLYIQYAHQNAMTTNKIYQSTTLEVEGSGYAEFNFTYELGYGSVDIAQPEGEAAALSLSYQLWDSGTWDVGTWDGQALTPTRYRTVGKAENISLIITRRSDEFEPLTFNGAVLRYLPGRDLR